MLPIRLRSENFTVVNNRAHLKSIPNFNGKPAMVLIMKNACGHCVRFKPVYKEIAQKIGSIFPVTYIEAADISPDLSSGLDFMGYPTIKFFNKNGTMVDEYNGPRDTQSILDAICKLYHTCI